MNRDGGPIVKFTWDELLALEQLPRGCLLAYADANLHERGNVGRHILTLGLSASEAARIVRNLRDVGLIDKNGGRIRANVWASISAQREAGSPAKNTSDDFDAAFLRSVGVLVD